MFVLEWSKPSNHLTNQDAYAPYISPVSVAIAWQHDLWCTIARCSTVGECSCCHITHFLGETKVYQLHMSVFINENVFWFQISINDIHLVQTLNSEHNLRQVEPCIVLAHED